VRVTLAFQSVDFNLLEQLLARQSEQAGRLGQDVAPSSRDRRTTRPGVLWVPPMLV
jgi:hypothetical protein